MGLFNKLLGKDTVTKKAGDDALLMHSLMLMAGADGVIEASEIATIEGFINTLPEFKNQNFGAIFESAKKVANRYPNLKDSVAALGEIESEAVKKKCFILAVDMAFSSGDVDSSEEELLEAMQRILGIDDGLATKVLEVFSLKYAS